ncbi:MAG: hypothetical protein AAF799_19200 [Myxococcota bacterium]
MALRGRIAALLLPVLGACAHPASTTPPALPAIDWIDAPLLGAPPREVDTLASLQTGDLRARQVRLDRLLDLFDAARFGQDDDARETFWAALGGHPTGVGEQASRDATVRLLEEALAIEDLSRRAANEEAASFAADSIMLLSTDLQPPGSAEDLSIRTLAYRTLVDQGHPRLVDNAHWRIYDHVRGTLAGAVEVGPGRRLEVAVQALYAVEESVEALLADTAPHARPPWPTADALWALLESQREPLSAMERWAPVVERRQGSDHALYDTLRSVLPAERRDDWPLTTVPAGTAKAETLAPVVWIHEGRMTIDAGRRHSRHVPLDREMVELSQALGNALAQDGRGTVLLVASPNLPAPQLQTTLRAASRAHAERIEVAVREARIGSTPGEVVVALPMFVTRASGTRAGDRAWAQSRVHVHLDGRGPRIALDGRWMDERPTDPAKLRTTVESLATAYPRERGVTLSLGGDIQLQQLIGLLSALQGGPERPFTAVGWFADGTRPPADKGQGEVALQRRTALSWATPHVEIEQPYPLKDDDQARLEGFASDLAVCLPELEAKRAPTSVTIGLQFEEGRLRSGELPDQRRLPKAGAAALLECVEEEGFALRLRNHREGITVKVSLSAAP